MNKVIYILFAISTMLSSMLIFHNVIGSTLSLIGIGMIVICNIIVYFWTSIDYRKMLWLTAIIFMIVTILTMIRITFKI